MTGGAVQHDAALPGTSGGGGTFALPERVRRILEPPPDLTVSQWCDQHRYLSKKYTAEPGSWRTSRVPYLREPMDALTDPSIQSITFIKCSRIAGTEWMLNLLAYSADVRPMPVLYVEPVKEMVEREFKGRMRSLFTDSERLRLHIPAGEWANVHKLSLDSMDIFGAWATSDQTLISLTIGLMLFNEIDNIVKHNGKLGDVLDVAVERITTFGHRGRVVVNGTATTSSAPGWRALKASDWRKPYVPCPHCGMYQVMRLHNLKLAPGHESERDPEAIIAGRLARLHCPPEEGGCDAMLEHQHWHKWMIDRTLWLPRTQTPADNPAGRLPVNRDDAASQHIVESASLAVQPPGSGGQWRPQLEGEPPVTTKRGYWINVLYSPWSSRTWSHILAKWFAVQGKPDQLRVFHNSWLGEPYEDAVEATSVETLAVKRTREHHIWTPDGDGSYPEGWIPPTARILLMGADVQGANRLDQIYYVIRAWGIWESSWLIRHGTAASFDQLYELAFYTGFAFGGAPGPGTTPGGRLRCHALAIDSRYRQDEVYEFARRPGVVAVKGEQSFDGVTKPFPCFRTPKGKPAPGTPLVHHVNTAYFKSRITRWMRIPQDQPGYWGLHRDTTDEYLTHVTNEHQVRHKITGKKGSRYELIWQPKTEGARVDWWDAEVYCAALAHLANVWQLREDSPVMGADIPLRPIAGTEGPPGSRDKGQGPRTQQRKTPDTGPTGGWGGGFGGGFIRGR